MTMGFNLIKDNIEGGTYKFSTLDNNIATVDENTEVVTAQGVGTTYIRIYNKQNDCYAAVKVQVNGEQGRTAAKIVGGWNHFVTLKANGEVWTWGNNKYGQLGTGDKATQTLPQQMVSVSGIKEIAAGTNHSVMLTEGGNILSAGSSTRSQMGDGSSTDRTTAVYTRNTSGYIVSNAKHIAAGGNSTYISRKKDTDGNN